MQSTHQRRVFPEVHSSRQRDLEIFRWEFLPQAPKQLTLVRRHTRCAGSRRSLDACNAALAPKRQAQLQQREVVDDVFIQLELHEQLHRATVKLLKASSD